LTTGAFVTRNACARTIGTAVPIQVGLCPIYQCFSVRSPYPLGSAKLPPFRTKRRTHRIQHDDGENDVWVTDGRVAIEITESRYLKIGYMPAINTLPLENSDW
jgi:hypothetical protein